MPELRPNVVFVITDDQGYGDLGCHGNTTIQTPNLDRFYSESVHFTNYHVGPTCAPTRAGLMTGRYCNCTGVWHTIAGRSLLREDEITLGDFFQSANYRTGMFGKWHLGDNYPFHPHNRGFDEALYHGGGGIHQTPDYWGNTYFNDTYFRNGVPEKFRGYCTDIWFDEACNFIERNKKHPFFCYISTNAPHSPYNVPNPYTELYRTTPSNLNDVPEERARFYGMISCIDENFGRLREHLKSLKIERNTILIFMTDNGSSAGCNLDGDGHLIDGFNAGMRGKKGSEYDGGHRTPFFFHWPNENFTQSHDINKLTANIDVLPTLLDLCNIELSEKNKARINGTSLVPLLKGHNKSWPNRVLITDSQRVEHPIKWRKSATMTERWRLINGNELYNIQNDPTQRDNIADKNPKIVQKLRENYENWWSLVSKKFDEDVPIPIATKKEPISILTTHDWHNENSTCAWNQSLIREGLECNGRWTIDVPVCGEYIFELRRWPREEDRPVIDSIPGKLTSYHGGRSIEVTNARICIDDQVKSKTIEPNDKGICFTFYLEPGEKSLETQFTNKGKISLGAYYVYVKKLN